MKKKLLYLFLFFMGNLSYAQFVCPTITTPLDGDTDVAVDTEIIWNEVAGTDGYLISLGTSPGARDLVDQLGLSDNFYTPPAGLPENTNIYVTITLFFFDQENIECPSEMFRTEDVTEPPACTTIATPLDGAMDVDAGTTIDWEYAPKATGYRLTLGTSSGGGEILDNVDVGIDPSYQPLANLPFDTEIFARIVPYNENGPAPGICIEISFTTETEAVRPNCASFVFPQDGDVDVPLTPTVEWTAVPGASGYKVSLGTSPSTNNILDAASYGTNSTPVIDFLPSGTFIMTVVPFNDAGDAIGCTSISFSTTKGCGPFLDEATGEMISLSPEIAFPDEVFLCLNENATVIRSEDIADGYRWYRVNDDDTESIISETAEVALSEEGTYRYEIFNIVSESGNTFECGNSKRFTVGTSEIATITAVEVIDQGGGIQIRVLTEGTGDYEYALDNIDGPYQVGNVFENLPIDSYTVYVRDKNACGIAEEKVNQGPTQEDFPNFFTPNGDNINDFWQFAPSLEAAEVDLDIIYIFDKFGKLMAQIEPTSKGWDGTFNGRLLPSADYWYRAVVRGSRELKGHFTLKR